MTGDKPMVLIYLLKGRNDVLDVNILGDDFPNGGTQTNLHVLQRLCW